MARLYDIQSKFTTNEFQCKCGQCDFGARESDIDQNLILKLNIMRVLYGKPMVVTSGARCPEHNLATGGVEYSAHLPHPDTGQCRAVDILVNGGAHRHELLTLAKNVGFERIGIAPYFLHLDVAWDLPTPTTFIY